MRQQIAWFTPLALNSAIGEFSRHVCAALAADADITIWTSDLAQPRGHTSLPVQTFALADFDLKDLERYDAVVYNLGNYLPYHGDIHAVSRKHPGIVILHDRSLHHLFSEMWLTGSYADPPMYIERMTVYYGELAGELARATLTGARPPVWESDEELLLFPLHEEAMIGAKGVISHTQDHAGELAQEWLGPVGELTLPCYRDVLNRADAAAREAVHDRTAGRLRALTIGHLNPNKQVHHVVNTLVSHPDVGRRLEYRVVGSDGGFHGYTKEIRRVIETHSEILDVRLLGRLSDAQLQRELVDADIYINLRHPNIEGGSASLMQEMAYGRPIVCFDSGIFAELPEETVVRVPVGDFEGVAEAIGRLERDSVLRRDVGLAARRFAERHTEVEYAADVLTFIERVHSAEPVLRFIDRVGTVLGEMEVDSRFAIHDEIAQDLGRILPI